MNVIIHVATKVSHLSAPESHEEASQGGKKGKPVSDQDFRWNGSPSLCQHHSFPGTSPPVENKLHQIQNPVWVDRYIAFGDISISYPGLLNIFFSFNSVKQMTKITQSEMCPTWDTEHIYIMLLWRNRSNPCNQIAVNITANMFVNALNNVMLMWWMLLFNIGYLH